MGDPFSLRGHSATCGTSTLALVIGSRLRERGEGVVPVGFVQ
ncbi:MAG: hypothetical protein ACP5IE_06950 [Infirmifilum sp.]